MMTPFFIDMYENKNRRMGACGKINKKGALSLGEVGKKNFGGILYTAHEAHNPTPIIFDFCFFLVSMLILGYVKFALHG